MESRTPRPARQHPKLLILFNRTDSEQTFTSVNSEDIATLSQDLSRHGYDTYVCNVDDDVDRVGDAVVVHRPALILNLVDHMFEDNSHHAAIASMLDLYGYVYTGSESADTCDVPRSCTHQTHFKRCRYFIPKFGVIRDINAIPPFETLHHMIVTQAFDDIYDDKESRMVIESHDTLNEHVRELSTQFDLLFWLKNFCRVGVYNAF